MCFKSVALSVTRIHLHRLRQPIPQRRVVYIPKYTVIYTVVKHSVLLLLIAYLRKVLFLSRCLPTPQNKLVQVLVPLKIHFYVVPRYLTVNVKAAKTIKRVLQLPVLLRQLIWLNCKLVLRLLL